MTDLTAAESTSVGYTRLGRTAASTVAELGPLADLVGTWVGAHGWTVMAVPSGEKGFRLIVRPYVEVVTFEPIGAPVPNRGGPVPDLFIAGLLYQTRVADRVTQEPLHLENGMWLNLGETQTPSIVRQASIPHGDVLLALGSASVQSGPPSIPTIDAVPNAGPHMPLGYTDPYLRPVPSPEVGGGSFTPASPNAALQSAIEGQQIVSTTTLTLSTEQGGGVLNIPFVDKQAKVPQFTCSFWIETVKDPSTGDEVQQLQYSQQANVEFLQSFGGPEGELIMWPHVNVNTLRKQ